ncbi:bifunctional adenosylcobinamide kinase/adenosylcobinamide-phosphate guanylyltransferase [Marinicellulosiphila megalodicopiae]|uniref:bifunctional adenosylcobinamide kinase/adenosylcobinamide-phosphate guanylyltransferase n=1 Tax=Marinicellulosiphila megalodicopiae TaxID=2724896 RepID=UPI003BB0061B
MLQLILGGTRSGKSQYAEAQINLLETQYPKSTITYIATAELFDEGMQQRADVHAKRRPSHWQLLESPVELTSTLNTLNHSNRIILVDCLTLWLNNQMYYLSQQSDIQNKSPSKPIQSSLNKCFDDLLHCLQNHKANIVLVSNEVGLGILPMDKSTREFADYAGTLNQKIAAVADKACLIVSGLPIHLKN